MKKRVVIINDELGTMALGFAKAGYDISAICIGQNDKNAIKELKTNWGNTVRIVDSESYPYCNAIADLDAECIAGRFFLNLARLEAEGNLAIKIIFFSKKGYQKKDIPFFCRINLLEGFLVCQFFI